MLDLNFKTTIYLYHLSLIFLPPTPTVITQNCKYSMENQDHQHSLDIVSTNSFEAVWLESFCEKKTQQKGNKYNPLADRKKISKSSFHILSVENLILLFLPLPPHKKKKTKKTHISYLPSP